MNNFETPVAFITCLCFLSEQILFADLYKTLQNFSTSEVQITASHEIYKLPNHLGKVIEHWGESPSFILIQDAHGQYQTQKKIEAILNYLHTKETFGSLYLEGGLGRLNPNLLRFFKEEKFNREAADFLAREAEVSGAELFLLNSEIASAVARPRNDTVAVIASERSERSNLKAFGAETGKYYVANLLAFRKVHAQKAQSDKYLHSFLGEIEAKASRKFNSDLKKFFKEWASHEKGIRDFGAYLGALDHRAENDLQLDLHHPRSQIDWPMLVRYFELRRREPLLNREKAEEERQKLIKWGKRKNKILPVPGSRKNGNLVPSGLDLRSTWEAYYAKALPKGFKFSDYPNLTLLEGYKILQSELEAPALFQEIEKIRDEILKKLTQNKSEEKILNDFRRYLLEKKLLNLELTRGEWEQIKALSVKRKAVSKNLKKSPNDSLTPYRLSLNAFTFYRLAELRDKIMMRNILTEALSDKRKGVSDSDSDSLNAYRLTPNASVLIAGGFHTSGITSQLREKGISYAVITPHIPELESDEKYVNSMLARKPTLDFGKYQLVQPPWIASDAHLPTEDITRRAEIRRKIIKEWTSRGATRAEMRTETASQDLTKMIMNGLALLSGPLTEALEENNRNDLKNMLGRVNDQITHLEANQSGRSETREKQEKYQNRISPSFIEKVITRLETQGKNEEAHEFKALTAQVRGFIEYDPNRPRANYRLVNQNEFKRFKELVVAAGFPESTVSLKGMIWEALLYNFFTRRSYSLSVGGRFTNLFYFRQHSLQPFAEEFQISFPSSREDAGIIPFTHLFYVKFWLARLFPELDEEFFGLSNFRNPPLDLMSALEGSMNGIDIEYFLSQLNESERKASDYGHNYKQANHKTREQMRQAILKSLDGIPEIQRDDLSAVQKRKLKAKALPYQSWSPLTFKVTESQAIGLSNGEVAVDEDEKVELIDVYTEWNQPDSIFDLPVFEIFKKTKLKISAALLEAANNSKQSVVFYDLDSTRLDSRDFGRILLEVIQEMQKTGQLGSLQKFSINVGKDEHSQVKDYAVQLLNGKLKLPETGIDRLEPGDIVELRSPFEYYERAVVLQVRRGKNPSIVLQTVLWWADSTIGFLISKKMYEGDFDSKRLSYSRKDLEAYRIHLVKEKPQEGYFINVGEKYQVTHKNKKYAATIVGLAGGSYILFLNKPVMTQLGGYVGFVPRMVAMDRVEGEEWKKIEKWPTRSEVRLQSVTKTQNPIQLEEADLSEAQKKLLNQMPPGGMHDVFESAFLDLNQNHWGEALNHFSGVIAMRSGMIMPWAAGSSSDIYRRAMIEIGRSLPVGVRLLFYRIQDGKVSKFPISQGIHTKLTENDLDGAVNLFVDFLNKKSHEEYQVAELQDFSFSIMRLLASLGRKELNKREKSLLIHLVRSIASAWKDWPASYFESEAIKKIVIAVTQFGYTLRLMNAYADAALLLQTYQEKTNNTQNPYLLAMLFTVFDSLASSYWKEGEQGKQKSLPFYAQSLVYLGAALKSNEFETKLKDEDKSGHRIYKIVVPHAIEYAENLSAADGAKDWQIAEEVLLDFVEGVEAFYIREKKRKHDLDPNFAAALADGVLQIATHWAKANRFILASIAIKIADQLNPQDPMIVYRKGKLEAAKGNIKNAQSALEEIEAISTSFNADNLRESIRLAKQRGKNLVPDRSYNLSHLTAPTNGKPAVDPSRVLPPARGVNGKKVSKETIRSETRAKNGDGKITKEEFLQTIEQLKSGGDTYSVISLPNDRLSVTRQNGIGYEYPLEVSGDDRYYGAILNALRKKMNGNGKSHRAEVRQSKIIASRPNMNLASQREAQRILDYGFIEFYDDFEHTSSPKIRYREMRKAFEEKLKEAEKRFPEKSEAWKSMRQLAKEARWARMAALVSYVKYVNADDDDFLFSLIHESQSNGSTEKQFILAKEMLEGLPVSVALEFLFQEIGAYFLSDEELIKYRRDLFPENGHNFGAKNNLNNLQTEFVQKNVPIQALEEIVGILLEMEISAVIEQDPNLKLEKEKSQGIRLRHEILGLRDKGRYIREKAYTRLRKVTEGKVPPKEIYKVIADLGLFEVILRTLLEKMRENIMDLDYPSLKDNYAFFTLYSKMVTQSWVDKNLWLKEEMNAYDRELKIFLNDAESIFERVVTQFEGSHRVAMNFTAKQIRKIVKGHLEEDFLPLKEMKAAVEDKELQGIILDFGSSGVPILNERTKKFQDKLQEMNGAYLKTLLILEEKLRTSVTARAEARKMTRTEYGDFLEELQATQWLIHDPQNEELGLSKKGLVNWPLIRSWSNEAFDEIMNMLEGKIVLRAFEQFHLNLIRDTFKKSQDTETILKNLEVLQKVIPILYEDSGVMEPINLHHLTELREAVPKHFKDTEEIAVLAIRIFTTMLKEEQLLDVKRSPRALRKKREAFLTLFNVLNVKEYPLKIMLAAIKGLQEILSETEIYDSSLVSTAQNLLGQIPSIVPTVPKMQYELAVLTEKIEVAIDLINKGYSLAVIQQEIQFISAPSPAKVHLPRRTFNIRVLINQNKKLHFLDSSPGTALEILRMVSAELQREDSQEQTFESIFARIKERILPYYGYELPSNNGKEIPNILSYIQTLENELQKPMEKQNLAAYIGNNERGSLIEEKVRYLQGRLVSIPKDVRSPVETALLEQLSKIVLDLKAAKAMLRANKTRSEMRTEGFAWELLHAAQEIFKRSEVRQSLTDRLRGMEIPLRSFLNELENKPDAFVKGRLSNEDQEKLKQQLRKGLKQLHLLKSGVDRLPKGFQARQQRLTAVAKLINQINFNTEFFKSRPGTLSDFLQRRENFNLAIHSDSMPAAIRSEVREIALTVTGGIFGLYSPQGLLISAGLPMLPPLPMKKPEILDADLQQMAEEIRDLAKRGGTAIVPGELLEGVFEEFNFLMKDVPSNAEVYIAEAPESMKRKQKGKIFVREEGFSKILASPSLDDKVAIGSFKEEDLGNSKKQIYAFHLQTEIFLSKRDKLRQAIQTVLFLLHASTLNESELQQVMQENGISKENKTLTSEILQNFISAARRLTAQSA